jgi:hypothetical protein
MKLRIHTTVLVMIRACYVEARVCFSILRSVGERKVKEEKCLPVCLPHSSGRRFILTGLFQYFDTSQDTVNYEITL